MHSDAETYLLIPLMTGLYTTTKYYKMYQYSRTKYLGLHVRVSPILINQTTMWYTGKLLVKYVLNNISI